VDTADPARCAARARRNSTNSSSATGASRAIVSERLAHLVEHGVMERVKYEAHPPRYEYRLTARGRALQPVMMMLAHWAEQRLDKCPNASARRPPPHHLRTTTSHP
jgi:DNA-binding HxlR family transcriptional regulator